MLNKSLEWTLLASAIFSLSACGGEPSESDIKTVVTKQIEAERKAMTQIGGAQAADMLKGLIPEISDVKKIGCKADGEKAYKCDVELTATQNGATNKGIAPMRFVKGSDGWVASK